MKKTYILFTIILIGLLSGCTETVPDDFELEKPADVAVVLNDLPYSDYLKLTNPVVTITVKDIGEIKVQLFPDVAPNTVNNFIGYVESGSYNDNLFHRVIDDFMIQAGKLYGACDIEGEMTRNYPENTLKHYRGVISMARLGGLDDSASSQFFIMEQTTNSLDGEYAAFGGVIDGFEVVDYIASLENGSSSVTIVDILIESMTVELNGYETSERICFE